MCKSLRKATISLFRGIAQIMLFTYFKSFEVIQMFLVLTV